MPGGGEDMDGSAWSTAAAGLIFGMIGTTLGGVIGVMMRKPGGRMISCLLHGTGGLMIAVVCFELLPQAYTLRMGCGVAGLALGIAAMTAGDAWLSRRMNGEKEFARAGMLLAAGVALHNLPEGLAVGSGFAHAPHLGAALALMIALHDVPEGLAEAVPMRVSGMSRARVLAVTALSGVPTGLGALLGAAAGGVSAEMIALSLGFAGGAMLQVTAQELLPQAGALWSGRTATLWLALGVAAGSVMTLMV